MRKLSETMKHLEERKDFVKNEDLKRRYQKEGIIIPENESIHIPKNFLSRKIFIEDEGLQEKYSNMETLPLSEMRKDTTHLKNEFRCLTFEEFIKSGI